MAVLAGLVLIGALVGLVVVGLRYRAEQREGARVRALFSRYVSPPIVDELLRRKDPRLYTGRSLQATIVVCRIWNFAGFAEALSPEETLRYLNEFFALAGTTIQKHRGMIDKFLSDGIIGVFGVPLEDPSAEEHALRAALDIVRLVDAMDQRWRAQGRRSFQVGIGINSGEVIAGDAGFHERREFTVVGPETLFAARLQEATSDLRAFVVAAASTCTPVRELFSLVPLTGHPLPGIKRLVDAFIVLGLTKETQTLTMPAASAFKETQVTAGAAPPAGVDPARPILAPSAASRTNAAPASAPKPALRVTPPPPEIVPLPRIELADPSAPLRRRRPADTGDAMFALPDGFTRDTNAPIFPDVQPPPGKRSAYDDGDGPPIQLPR
jgi:class 3 adenylate cyclase